MQSYKKAFIEFCLEKKVLLFGEFTLKSGRISPYFFNMGQFKTGNDLMQLGSFYASAIQAANIEFDVLFGPAYKGIPLACACAIALAKEFGCDKPYCFNRKEAKDHGEGGLLVGAELKGKVLIIDDVMTAGTAAGQAIGLIQQHHAAVAGVIIALDRQERGQGKASAVQTLEAQYHMPVLSIITMSDVLSYVEENQHVVTPENVKGMLAYRAEYGV